MESNPNYANSTDLTSEETKEMTTNMGESLIFTADETDLTDQDQDKNDHNNSIKSRSDICTEDIAVPDFVPFMPFWQRKRRIKNINRNQQVVSFLSSVISYGIGFILLCYVYMPSYPLYRNMW